MSDVSSAIDKLSQLQNDSGTSNVENRFNEATEGLSVYTVNKIDALKEEKNNLIQATVMNTISQCSNYYDMKGIKDNKTLKSIEQLGVSVLYATEDNGSGTSLHVLLKQDGKAIVYKLVEFMPSNMKCDGKGELIEYDASNVIAAVGAGVAMYGGSALTTAVVTGGVSAAKKVPETAGKQLLGQQVKTGVKEAKSVSASVAGKVGAVTAKGATAAVKGGAKVARKAGAQGAQEVSEKVAEKLLDPNIQKELGYGVIVVGAVVGAYCLYKGCEYTPKVYHYMDKPDVAVSFTLMRSSRDTKQLGVSKEGQSVLVTAIDYFDEPVNPAEAFPTVPKSRRKGLYGLYATNSTGWPVSNERKDKLKRKYDELRKSVI